MTASLSFFNFTTFIVILAAFLDICANLLLAASGGFHRKFAGIGALVLVGAAFYCLSLAVQKMDLAVAYALWGSFGILGTSLGGWLFIRISAGFFNRLRFFHLRRFLGQHQVAGYRNNSGNLSGNTYCLLFFGIILYHTQQNHPARIHFCIDSG